MAHLPPCLQTTTRSQVHNHVVRVEPYCPLLYDNYGMHKVSKRSFS
jgi:hypothetical protein